MLTDSSIGVLKLKNLWRVLSSDKRQTFLDRMETIQQSLWSGRIMPISTDEEFERVSRSFAGIPEMSDADQADVAAACGFPITVLFGRSPAGMNATGESDLKIWHGIADSERRTKITPQAEAIVQLLAVEAGAPDPENYGVEWPCLEQLTLKETADLLKTEAETDDLRIGQGVPEEAVLRHRLGGAEYNHSPLSLSDDELDDLDAREAAEAGAATEEVEEAELEGDPTAPDVPDGGKVDPAEAVNPATALNGAQMAGAMEIVKAVVAKEIPRSSGVELLLVSLPIDRSAAERIMGEAGKGFEPEAPEVAPPGTPPTPGKTPPALAPFAEKTKAAAKGEEAELEGEEPEPDDDPEEGDDER
jgi:hypothetical protein